MGRPAADEYRLRLEGRAELLETARLRYRALMEALGARPWEERLRKDLALLREALGAQARVDDALAAALRRAQAEGWPALSPTVQLLRDAQALREKLAQTAAQRLARPPGESLSVLLAALEERVLTAPREVPPAQREATALELLPETLPLVREVSTFGALLEPFFAEPWDAEAPLPPRFREVSALKEAWPRGEKAVASAWSRLSGVDRTGGLVGELRKRAERGPLHPPRSGPEWLAHATYWRGVARKRLEGLVKVRFAPLVPLESEYLELAWWLCAREANPEARLPASAVVGEARAGLLELVHELWDAFRLGRTDEARQLDAWWERVRERARRADTMARGADAEQARHLLRAFIWKRAMGTTLGRGWQETSHRLEALVEQAWSVDRSLSGG